MANVKGAKRKPRQPIDVCIHEILLKRQATLLYIRQNKEIYDIIHILNNKVDIGETEVTLALPYKHGKRIYNKSKVLKLSEIVEQYVKGNMILMKGTPVLLPSDVIDENEFYRLLVVDIEVDYKEQDNRKVITSISFVLQSVSAHYSVMVGLGDDNVYAFIISNIETTDILVNTSLRKDFVPLEEVKHADMESQVVFKKALNTVKKVVDQFYENK